MVLRRNLVLASPLKENWQWATQTAEQEPKGPPTPRAKTSRMLPNTRLVRELRLSLRKRQRNQSARRRTKLPSKKRKRAFLRTSGRWSPKSRIGSSRTANSTSLSRKSQTQCCLRICSARSVTRTLWQLRPSTSISSRASQRTSGRTCRRTGGWGWILSRISRASRQRERWWIWRRSQTASWTRHLWRVTWNRGYSGNPTSSRTPLFPAIFHFSTQTTSLRVDLFTN